ncbi:MAG: glycosyltransferase family 4 protein [Verrucomicrobia bacterium]|nr:glycosyltransferase family 4 protein [Verrucomicrobiota bacterium]
MQRTILFSNYDAPGNPYYGGGGAHAIHAVASRLARRHAVTVLTWRYPGARAEVVDGVRYERVGFGRGDPRLAQLIYQFLLPVQLRRFEWDLWIESLTPPFSTACLPWFTRRPVVALTQVLAGKGMTRAYRLPFATVERLGLRAYRYAIALSAHLQSELLAANPRLRVAVIPNGVSRDLIELQVERDEAHLLFLGRLDVAQKGLDLLLDALAQSQPPPTLPVVIAGAGTPRDQAWLARRLAELGLAKWVRTVGRVGPAEKHELLRRAQLLLLPSRFEASPIVPLEACCYAVPVVLFDLPDLAELPPHACVKVPPWDTAAYAQAIVTLARDAPRRRALGQAAKAFVREFDWDTLAARYEDFFESILETR